MLHSRNGAWLIAFVALAAPPSSCSAQSEAETISASFRKASQRVLPAVVTVRAQGPSGRLEPAPAPLPEPGFVEGPYPGPLVPDPFRRDPGGSGVVIDAAKGLVLTNNHVVPPGRNLVVTLADGRQRPVKQVRRDPRGDLALLVIDPDGLQQASWGDSASLEIGDWVLAIGQPFGLTGTVSAGIISGKGRRLGPVVAYDDLLQTDAAISPGSSGGPLVNLKGEVVGITLALKTYGGGFEGVGLAIPAQRAKRVAAELAEHGRVQRAYLGIEIGPVDPATAQGLERPGAVAIGSVVAGSPAATAGLRAGDVIIKVNGRPIAGPASVRAAIEATPVGEPLILTIVRGTETREIQARPEVRREPEAGRTSRTRPALPPGNDVPGDLRPVPEPEFREQLEARAPTRFPALGLRLEEPTADLRKRFGLDPDLKGLVVLGVEPDSVADQGGLEVGMVITDADNRRVSSLADFRAVLSRRAAGHDLVVRIVKDGRPGFRVILDATATRSTPSAEPEPERPPALPPLREPQR